MSPDRSNRLASSALALLIAGPPGDGGVDGVEEVQRGPEVSEARHDTSRPLRDLPPAERKPGQRVHAVKPLPRPPHPAPPPETPPDPPKDPPRDQPPIEKPR